MKGFYRKIRTVMTDFVETFIMYVILSIITGGKVSISEFI